MLDFSSVEPSRDIDDCGLESTALPRSVRASSNTLGEDHPIAPQTKADERNDNTEVLIHSQISADVNPSLALRCDPSNVFFHNDSYHRASRFMRTALEGPSRFRLLLRLAIREGRHSRPQGGGFKALPAELFEEFATFFEVPVVRSRLREVAVEKLQRLGVVALL